MNAIAPGQQDHFEALYAASDDPWGVRESWYERRKRNLLLACLDRPRFASAFEPGCGNGEMSVALAARCDTVLACDGAASAVAAARRRLGDAALPGGAVRIEQRSLPDAWPLDETFDLIVISELAYYFDAAGVAALAAAVSATLADGGVLALCHWRHDFADRVSATAAVHAAFHGAPGMHGVLRHKEDDFLLELLTRRQPGDTVGARP